MIQTERIQDFQEALRAALQDWEANLWTAAPGIIEAFDSSKIVASVALAVQCRVRTQSGSYVWKQPPLLVNCPVVFPNGGNFMVTFPITIGNECLVVFASRCIDTWWQQGVAGIAPEIRMHDLSDGFVIVGPRSQPSILAGQPAISTSTAQLRTKDGSAYIELTTDGKVNILAPGGVHVTGVVIASGEGTFNGGHTVSAHVHGGVQSGGSNTGTPTG